MQSMSLGWFPFSAPSFSKMNPGVTLRNMTDQDIRQNNAKKGYTR
jgi:hypothetical protein